MPEWMVNKEPMDYRLIEIPGSVGLEDHSYRRGDNPFGLWKITSGGVLERFLFITREQYPQAILVSNEVDARKALKDEGIYQVYLDGQPPAYGEVEYYRYHVNDMHTELVQAHIPQDLARAFKVRCQEKGIKQREALATIITKWLKTPE